jgi:hypothetical protein
MKMKKLVLIILPVLFVAFSFGQMNTTDKIYKHNGEALQVKILKVSESVITFKYPNEEAEQTLGKLAVDRIEYGSGRTEKVSDKVVINGKGDWEKVQIITDATAIVGLRKGDEISGKTSSWASYNTQSGADKKSTKHIKESAAEHNAPYVLLTADKEVANWSGVAQGLKRGFAYTYN